MHKSYSHAPHKAQKYTTSPVTVERKQKAQANMHREALRMTFSAVLRRFWCEHADSSTTQLPGAL